MLKHPYHATTFDSPMSSITFPLNDLPTEVQLCVLDTLEREDLYSLCLVSRGYDAIVSPILYKAVEWNDATTRTSYGILSAGFDVNGEYVCSCPTRYNHPNS
jgi:hypothetical protein